MLNECTCWSIRGDVLRRENRRQHDASSNIKSPKAYYRTEEERDGFVVGAEGSNQHVDGAAAALRSFGSGAGTGTGLGCVSRV
jgi:hypothetical protein